MRKHHRDEDGIAMITALLAVVILSGLAIVFVARATTETVASGASRDHESAVHVAEAAADNQVRFANLNDDHVTADRSGVAISVDPASLGDEEAWARGLLGVMRPDGAGNASNGWVTMDGGEGYAVRPHDTVADEPMNVIYGVGAVPSFDAANARVRVIKLQIDQDRFIPEFALLTDGALRFGGNAAIVVPGCDTSTADQAQATCIADVHTNKAFTNPGNASTIQGRVSQVDGTCPSGITAVNGCVDAGDGVAPKEIPVFSSRDFYNRDADKFNPDPEGQSVEWFDLCPPGKPIAGVATVRRPGTEPCMAGSEQIWPHPDTPGSTFRGWRWQANQWQASAIGAGVFYVYHADAKVTGSDGPGQRAVSIIVEQNPTSKGSSGSLDLSGNPKMQAALQNVLFVTDADLDMHGTTTGGTGTSCGETETSFAGFIGVGEQLKTQGTVELRGAVIERDRADDHNLVQRTNAGVGGTMCLEFDKDLVIDFTGIWVITFWNEL
jgi:hypothetical protein